MAANKPPQTQLRVGRLTKAHGLKGAIKLELFTDTPEERFVPGAVFSLQVPTGSKWHGKTIELVELRWYNGHAVGFFAGVGDRSEAETLIKAILWVNQDADALPREEDAWYDHQLVGLSALRDGVKVGSIARVDHLPAQDLLVVKTPGGEVLVPFVKAIVPAVDIEAGTVTLTPPLGLFEEVADDEEAVDGDAIDGDAVDGAALAGEALDDADVDEVAVDEVAADEVAADEVAVDEPGVDDDTVTNTTVRLAEEGAPPASQGSGG